MKANVLIVDDDPLNRKLIKVSLSKEQYDIAKASDGLIALEQIKANPPDLILLDVMMPKEGGIQMYRELKTDDQLKHIPVIMLSAVAKKTFFHSQTMLNTHMGQSVPEPEAYIEKPPEPEELFQLTTNLLTD